MSEEVRILESMIRMLGREKRELEAKLAKRVYVVNETGNGLDLQRCENCDEWHPIATAPKDVSHPAIWLANAEGMEPAHWHKPWAAFAKSGWRNCYTGEPIAWEPTHWRHLPPLPSSLVKEAG